MLLAETLVLSQKSTTDGLNRSPVTSVLPRRVGEFGHGLLCFGHFSFLSLVFIAKVEDDAAILVDDERGVEFAALP